MTVDGTPARHAREGAELVVTPAAPVRAGAVFTVEVGYDGRPVPLRNETIGEGGWLHTADGAVALGQPESASTWFPVNDHPSDKATYDVEITVPQGLVAVANGVPQGQRPAAGGWTTWRWSETTPMASYLSTVVIGKYRTTTGEHRGRPVFSAVASSLPRGPPTRRSPAPWRSPTTWRASSGGTRSGRTAGWWSTSPGSGTRWRRRAGPSTRPTSSGPARTPRWWRTNWPTSGSATASRWPAGRTSGSTRGWPRTPSGSGPSTRAGTPRRPPSTRSTSPPTTRSGGCRPVRPGWRTCSAARSTSGVR